jgi:hypothetical protein
MANSDSANADAYFFVEYSVGQHSSLINLLHEIAQNRPLLMFHMDKMLDGDTKPLQLLILFQEVIQLGVPTLQLIVRLLM